MSVFIKKAFLYIVIFLSAPCMLLGQQSITLSEAIRIALEKNLGIKIAQLEKEIPAINNSLGEAGFLPSVSAGGGIEFLDEKTTYSDASDPAYDKNYISNADISLSWTIFFGFRVFSNRKNLAELEKLGNVEAKIIIEDIITNIINAYLNVLSLEKRLEVLRNTVEISKDREEVANRKFKLGAGSEYDLLVAQTDLNTDQSNVIRQEAELHEARLYLNNLLNTTEHERYVFNDEIEISSLDDLETLREKTLDNNSQLHASRIESKVEEINLRKINQSRLPEISLDASLYKNNLPAKGTHAGEKSSCNIVGVTARVPLFNGFERNRRAKIAKIQIESQKVKQQELINKMNNHLVSMHQNFLYAQKLHELEVENLRLANNALNIALERFKLGNITSVELRESQRTLLNTENRLIDALFEAKMYEAEILRLTGELDNYLMQDLD